MAGAPWSIATLLGVSMTALQASIGVTNDLVDAEHDAGRPDKPLADGRLPRGAGVALAAIAATVGLVLAAASSGPTLLLAGLVLAIGLAYDVAFKGTSWSWLPFALGIPVLPAFAWTGAAGVLPPGYAFLAPAAFVAGAGLAVGNTVADAERDAAAGVVTMATAWGRRRAWLVHVGLLGIALVGVALELVALGGRPVGVALVGLGGSLVFAGAVALRSSRRAGAAHTFGWELEATGVALAGAGWLAAMVL